MSYLNDVIFLASAVLCMIDLACFVFARIHKVFVNYRVMIGFSF